MNSRPELPPPGDQVAVIQALNARGGVSNVNVNLATNVDTYFPGTQGITLPNLQCTTGEANIDNVCVCPRSLNSSPFVPYNKQYRGEYMDKLFTPAVGMTDLTPAAQHVADRFNQRIRQ